MSVAPAMPTGSPLLRIPHDTHTRRAFLLAALVHGLLIIFLVIGVQWQSSPPAGAEAELWDEVPEVRTPQPPTPVAPEPVIQPKVQDEADIALEQRKLKRIEQASVLALAVQQKQRLAKEHAEAAHLKKLQAQQDNIEKEKKALKEKHKAELAKPVKPVEPPKEKHSKEKTDKKLAEAQLAKQREEQLLRMRGGVGAGGSGATQGGAAIGGGGDASPGYREKIRRKVEPNIDYQGQSGDGGQTAEALVRVAPSGEVLSRKLTKPSNNPEWNQAILHAIDKASPLPKDVNGAIPAEALRNGLTIKFRLRKP